MPSPSRTPTLEEVLKIAFLAQIEGVHTSIPGKVTSYDPGTQSASIQPLIMNSVTPDEGDLIVETMPVINRVHVGFPRTASLFLNLGVSVGDMGMLIFSEKSMDLWSTGAGDITDPKDTRRFDLADAVFYPGVFPFQKALKNATTQGVKFGSDATNGMRVEVTDSNGFVITMGNGQTLVVKGNGELTTLTLGSGAHPVALADQLQTLWEQLTLYLSTLILPVTGTAAGGLALTATAGPPPAPAPEWVPTINSTSTKVPG